MKNKGPSREILGSRIVPLFTLSSNGEVHYNQKHYERYVASQRIGPPPKSMIHERMRLRPCLPALHLFRCESLSRLASAPCTLTEQQEPRVQRSADSCSDSDDVLPFILNCEFCQSLLLLFLNHKSVGALYSDSFINHLFSRTFSDLPCISRWFGMTISYYEHPGLYFFHSLELLSFTSHVVREFIRFCSFCCEKALCCSSHVLCCSAVLIVSLTQAAACTATVVILSVRAGCACHRRG